MNVIKRIYKILFDEMKYLSWVWQYFIVRSKYRKSIICDENTKPLNISKYNNILIIVPHADDDLIGNFGILKYAKKITIYHVGNYPIKNVVLTKRREEELKSLSLVFNAPIIEKQSSDHIFNIIKQLEESNYDAIFTPAFNDWHEDHQAATGYLLSALQQSLVKPDIFLYTITVPFSYKESCRYVPLSMSLQKEKWNIFKNIYISQSFMPIARFRLQEKLNALRIRGIYSAELYRQVTEDELQELYKSKPDDKMREHIKGLINNIIDIRKYSENENSFSTI